MKQQNNKNDFFNLSEFLQLHRGYFLWTETFDFAVTILDALPFCKSTSFLVDFLCFSKLNILIEDKNTILVLKHLKQYTYDNLAVSIIFYYLKTIYKEKNCLTYNDWEKIIAALLQPNLTNSVFFFLEKFDMMNFLLETKSEGQFLTGLLLYFKITAISTKKSEDLKEIKNLLKFLKVDQSLIDSLVEKTSNQANFKDLTAFLKKYQFTT